MEDLNKNKDAEILDDEKDVLLDHNYDGIRELDNHMPRWWVLGFYFTIIVAVVYMLYYHVTGWGPSSAEEYQMEMAAAEEKYGQMNDSGLELKDSYELLTAQEDLEAGKIAYNRICNACHGAAGEGSVGPNLTDEYWIHGCSPKEIMVSIKDGFPAKGMPAYGGGPSLNEEELVQVASYINSLQGTNPPNAKAADMSRAVECDIDEAGSKTAEESQPASSTP